MLYFLEKAGKIAAALGAPPPNPRWSPAAWGSGLGVCPQTPELLFLSLVIVAFLSTFPVLTWILSKKNNIAKIGAPTQFTCYRYFWVLLKIFDIVKITTLSHT